MPRKVKKTKVDLLKAKKQEAWADYADEKLVPKYLVYRYDDNAENRFYFFHKEGEIIISCGVTTAFGVVSTEREAINEWKAKYSNWRQLLNASSNYGTLEHILFGGIALGNGVNKTVLESMKVIAKANDRSSDMPEKDTLAFLKFVEDYKPKPLLVEAKLVWNDGAGEWLAMTIDMLAQIEVIDVKKEMVEDGVWQRGDKKGEVKMVEKKTETKRTITALIDFKSNFFEKDKKSFYESHRMQLMAGRLAVEQNFGVKVDALYNYASNAWRTTPSYTLYEHKPTPKDEKKFVAYWNLIIADEINKPVGNILVAGEYKNSSDFRMMTYREYVEQVLLSEK